MKKTVIRAGIILALFFAGLTTLKAQVIKGDLLIGDTTQVHRVITKRGDEFYGRVTQIQNTQVDFLFNKTIELTFQLQDLQEISVVTPGKVSRTHAYDENRKEYTRLEQKLHGHERGYYLPSGFLLKRGQMEFRNMGFFYNSLEFGLTDNLNLGVGGIPLLVANAIQLKLRAGGSVSDFLHMSVNGNGYVAIALGEEVLSAASLTGVASLGSPDRHLSFGGGYGFGFGGTADEGVLVAQLGGSYRFSPNWRFFLEGIVPVNQPQWLLISSGVNWIYREHRIEFGLSFIRTDFQASFPFPFIGYGGRFKNRN
jgi:hypothetical protein